MSLLSGRLAAINGVPSVGLWEIAEKAAQAEYVNSATDGGTGRLAGNLDWNGHYEADGAVPAVLPGAALSLLGSCDGALGVSGEALVDDVEINWDIEGGKHISHTVNFSANGALTRGAAVAADASLSNPETSIGTKAELGTVAAVPVFTELADVRKMKLKLSAKNTNYVSSSTAGQTKRIRGPIDADISLDVYCEDLADLPAVNSISALRLYTSATLFFLVNWAIFGEATGIQADRRTGKLVGATLNAKLCGLATVGGTRTMGGIWLPGATLWWPE